MAVLKKEVKKATKVVKEVKLVASKAKVEAKTKTKVPAKIGHLSVEVFDLLGKSAGTVTLPKEVFAQPVNKVLIAQAIRVYQTNISTHTAHTKTRGEVSGGGAKPWKQKGTGKARAGSSRSPIWVGGGKAFGPRFRDKKLAIPQKMKRGALISALSAKLNDKEIKVVSGFENSQPKTKSIVNLVKNLNLSGTTLIVIPEKNENLKLATRNIQKVSIDVVTNLNALTVLSCKNLVLSKESIEKFK